MGLKVLRSISALYISICGENLGMEVRIGGQQIFTVEQSRSLIGLVFKITKEAAALADPILSELDRLSRLGDTETAKVLEEDLNKIIVRWHEKIRRLGAHPQGLWLVDFDCGRGFLCWKYPEPDIMYWHEYDGGFTNRKPIETYPVASKVNTKNLVHTKPQDTSSSVTTDDLKGS